MEDIRNLSRIKTIAETADLLLSSRGEYQKTLNVIVESSLRVSGADRSCLIIKDEKDTLMIKSGVPFHAHGIGTEIAPDTGEHFLRRIMGDDSMVLITNPREDNRVSYMRGLTAVNKISSILFLPLRSGGESIGVLVLDWIEGRKFSRDNIENIKLLAGLASTAISMEYKGQKDHKKILQDEKLRALGEHSSQMAHIIRNSLATIGGFSARLLKCLSMESKYGRSGFNSGFIDTLRENVEIIDDESKKLESIVNDILTFTGFKEPVLKPCNLNKFLAEESSLMVFKGLRPALKLSKRLDGLNVAFDRDMLAVCISDLARYSAEAAASRIVIKTKLKPKQKEILISFIHNGRPIHPHVMKDLFSPFVTSEIDGSGLGLANVQSIVLRHGGSISALSGDTTEFRITLPLIMCNGTAAD